MPNVPDPKEANVMYEYHLFVPIAFNDGTPVSPCELAGFERDLTTGFGGFTCMDGFSGTWRSADGQIYRDRLKNYIVATTDEAHLIEFVHALGRRLGQRAMYLHRQTSTTMIIDIEHQ